MFLLFTYLLFLEVVFWLEFTKGEIIFLTNLTAFVLYLVQSELKEVTVNLCYLRTFSQRDSPRNEA